MTWSTNACPPGRELRAVRNFSAPPPHPVLQDVPLAHRNGTKGGMTSGKTLRQRLTALESHLKAEKPDLLPVFRAYRDFDRLLQRIGLLARGESLATRTPWWPVIAVLGPAAAGRAAILNGFRPTGGERTADDRFTVLLHGGDASATDPRVPVDLDAPLRIEASDHERLRGRILVEAPGGAGQPHERLVELSDLVLVFPDAGGAAPDELALLLATASRRADARKILTIRSDADLVGIDARLAETEAGRGRRVAGLLGAVAEEVEDELIPYVEASLARWRRNVRLGAMAWLVLLALVLGGAVVLGGSDNLPAFAGWLVEARPAPLGGLPIRLLALVAGVGGLWLAGYQWVRLSAAQRVAASLPVRMGEADLDPRCAFLRSGGLFSTGVSGWGRRARRRLAAIRELAAAHTHASGERSARPQPAVAKLDG